jgi:hypothetical protein
MAQRSCAEFLSKFVLPLVAGGEMHVGKPIDADELQRFEEELPHASVPLVAIDDARTAVISTVVVRPPALVFDTDELALSAAVHNLLFLAHPRIDTWSISRAGRAKVVATAQRFATRPRSEGRLRVLARHGLLHNFFEISRRDVKVSWWTGSAIFLGQTPPSRLSAWSGIRRVRREETFTSFQELLGGADVAPVVVTLVRRSPLSHLLTTSRLGPPLHWEDAVFLLRDAEFARAIAYRCISEVGEGSLKSACRFAAGFEQMLERAPREPDVRAVAAFLVHLNALLALEEVGGDLRDDSPLLTSLLGAGQRPRGLATLLALPNALYQVDPRLAEPPGLVREPALAARWQVHRKQVFEALGDGVIDSLAERLRRHLRAVLESPETADGTSTEHSAR